MKYKTRSEHTFDGRHLVLGDNVIAVPTDSFGNHEGEWHFEDIAVAGRCIQFMGDDPLFEVFVRGKPQHRVGLRFVPTESKLEPGTWTWPNPA